MSEKRLAEQAWDAVKGKVGVSDWGRENSLVIAKMNELHEAMLLRLHVLKRYIDPATIEEIYQNEFWRAPEARSNFRLVRSDEIAPELEATISRSADGSSMFDDPLWMVIRDFWRTAKGKVEDHLKLLGNMEIEAERMEALHAAKNERIRKLEAALAAIAAIEPVETVFIDYNAGYEKALEDCQQHCHPTEVTS